MTEPVYITLAQGQRARRLAGAAAIVVMLREDADDVVAEWNVLGPPMLTAIMRDTLTEAVGEIAVVLGRSEGADRPTGASARGSAAAGASGAAGPYPGGGL